MIKEKLLDKNYYLSKLSMFMKEAYGIEDNVDMLLDWMKSLNSASDYLTNILDIWNDDYKDEMSETFGLMYKYRKYPESPELFRGVFKGNNNVEIHMNNTSAVIGGQEYEFLYSTNQNEFYGAKKSEDGQFVNGRTYLLYYTVEGILETARPINANKGNRLYEQSGNDFIETSDQTFQNGKDYYIDSNGETFATPINCDLYTDTAYIFKYTQLDSPSINVTPLYLNFFEKSGNNYINTSDATFNSSKTYYYQSSESDRPDDNFTRAAEWDAMFVLYKTTSLDSECKYTDNPTYTFNQSTYYIRDKFQYKQYGNSNFITLKKQNTVYVYENPYKEDHDDEAQQFKFLDVIASIVGCSRNNRVKTDEGIYFDFVLSNEDLLDLIKIRIIQNNYKGTLQEILELYRDKLNYELYISLRNADGGGYESASCNVYLLETKTNSEAISTYMKLLFQYSDLLIQSLGIAYNKALLSSLDNILILEKSYAYKNEKAVYPDNAAIPASDTFDSSAIYYIDINMTTIASPLVLSLYRKDTNNNCIFATSSNRFTSDVDWYRPTITSVNNPTGNPKLQGWYELVSSDYIKTDDETVVDGKTYYTVVFGSAVTTRNANNGNTLYEKKATRVVLG